MHNEVVGEVRQFEERAGETVFTSVDAIPIALGGRLDLVSVYPIAQGAVTELDTLTPSTDWTANVAADGSGTDRTSQVDIQIELMDFNETHITITYPTMSGVQADTLYIHDLAITGTVLTESVPLRVVREDTVSKERYRPKTLPLRGVWIRSVADMESRADEILDLIAKPERRLSLDWYVRDWTEFLSLDLSDRVGVEMPTITSDGFIEAIRVVIPLSRVNIVCTVDVSLVESAPTPPPPPPPPVMSKWAEFEALTGALGIRFTASANLVDLYEFSPPEGMLLNATPGQHSVDTIYWIERVRISSGQIQIHRGGSAVDSNTYLAGLGADWTLYIVSETSGAYLAIQANDYNTAGGGFANWTSGTWTLVSSHLGSFADATAFLNSLVDDIVIVGLANDAGWVPYS